MNEQDRVRVGPPPAHQGMVRQGLALSVVLHIIPVLVLWFPLRDTVATIDAAGPVLLVMATPAQEAAATPRDLAAARLQTGPQRQAPQEPVPPPKAIAPVETMPQAQGVGTATDQPSAPDPNRLNPAPPTLVAAPPQPLPRSHPGARLPRPVQAQPGAVAYPAVSPSQVTSAPGTIQAPMPATTEAATAIADPAWLAGVGAWLLAHRTYPEMARALGRQGIVVIRITVASDGHVEGIDLVRGSGSDSLDHAAEMLVRDAHLPPFPPDMGMPRQIVTIPIRYRLE